MRHFWIFLSIEFLFLEGGPPWQSNFTRSSRSWLSEVRICHLYSWDLLIWSLKLAVFTHLLAPGMEVRDGRRLRQARPAAGIFSWVSFGWFTCAQTLICFWTIFNLLTISIQLSGSLTVLNVPDQEPFWGMVSLVCVTPTIISLQV